MADILDFSENTAPVGGDAMYIVDDPAGTPADEYITLNNLTFGQAHEVQIILLDSNTELSTGDGFSNVTLVIGDMLAGHNLVDAQAAVDTASSTGLPTFQLYNITQAADVLSTKITIDETEYNSFAPTTPSVVNTGEDGLTLGDIFRFDCDVSGTGTKGAKIIIRTQKP